MGRLLMQAFQCRGDPLQSWVESIVDEADIEEVYNTERNLLYVACTRARDHPVNWTPHSVKTGRLHARAGPSAGYWGKARLRVP